MSVFLLLLVSAQEIRATQESDGLIRVVSAGRFETTFTKRKGFGATWFDLKHDPERKRDLAPVLDENGFFWIKIGKPGTDGSWYANPAEEMTLLEAGPARVRLRLRGAHMRYGNTDAKAAWKELRFDQTWTLSPDGSAFVSYVLEQDEPVTYHHFLVITKANGAWGPKGKGEARVAGETGAEKPTSKTPTSFTLQWTDGPTYFTDILMVAQKGKFGASYWNEGYNDKDLRCSFDLGPLWPDKTLPAGKQRVNFLMRFADDINSAEAAALHAQDYRSPGRLTAAKGAVDTTDEGDRDADGFNEGEGCSVLKAAAEGVDFTIHGKAVPRVNPAFKIKGWTGPAPAEVAIGGAKASVVTSLHDGTLLVQLFAIVRDDVAVSIRPGGK
ncbi:MAG TPA: hypothetical protein VJB14_04610 [Planctomycetota bacterium]|nr:hypothetical protein [Planctomycetota bacterium]